MIKYFLSLEFWVTLFLFFVLLKFIGIGDLANYIQVTQVFAWSYIIYRLDKHNKLLKDIFEDEEQ